MKKLFYFLKSSLKYVEIKKFRSKLAIFFSFLFLVVIASGVGGFFILSSVYSPNKSFNQVNSENTILKKNWT